MNRKEIILAGEPYQVRRLLGQGGCARVLLVEDRDGHPFALKIFPAWVRCSAHLGRHNHHGQAREAHPVVFAEIQRLGQAYPFLVAHHHRQFIDHRWHLLLEHLPGEPMPRWLRQWRGHRPRLALAACEELGRVLRQWHGHGLAHGDPHLGNAMVTIVNGTPRVRLVDHSHLHHQSLHFCRRCGCNMGQRQAEDLENPCENIGGGFLAHLRRQFGKKYGKALLAGYGEHFGEKSIEDQQTREVRNVHEKA